MTEIDRLVHDLVADVSPELAKMILSENIRQWATVELIASENFMSDAVRAALASSLVNKYAEGRPGARYYGGCANVDDVERLCEHLWKKVFSEEYHVNVQPHSGSQANFAAYASVLEPGDVILAPSFDAGAHLTHSSPVSFVTKLYNVVTYGVDDDGYIDYAEMRRMAHKCKPKLILAGASAYSREINFEAFANVAEDVGAYFMVDMAHIAGLVAAGYHKSPFGLADLITTTTQKTLRGPRGGLVFCKKELAKNVDKAVFPFSQGGPHMNTIASKAVCAIEALSDSYKIYIQNVVASCKVMAAEFGRLGYRVVTGGTDNHMFLLDLSSKFPHMSGATAQEALELCGINTNKNLLPHDARSARETSGLRIGTAAMTTRGWTIDDFIACARRIDKILQETYEG